MKTVRLLTVAVLTLSLLLFGCHSSKNVQGGAIGAGAGAVVGGLLGHHAGNTAAGAILGAAIGGAAGALIGNYMDRQAEEMKKDLKNAKIERIGEGIKITFASGILFDVNKYDLRPDARNDVTRLSTILKKYSDTNILVEGHTDSDGPADYNQKLSEERAQSVADYAKSLGVDGSRFKTVGYGESQPIASNSTVEGKQMNRRVEVAIFANDKLKKAAENGDLKSE